jgi:hypothetical protein
VLFQGGHLTGVTHDIAIMILGSPVKEFGQGGLAYSLTFRFLRDGAALVSLLTDLDFC